MAALPLSCGRSLLRLVLIGVACVATWPLASQDEVMIVLSSEAPPYRQAATAISERLAGVQAIKPVLLDQLRGEPPAGKTWIAIGSTAAARLRPLLGPDQRLIYCLVTDPAAAGLLDDPRIHGISATVPLATQFALLGAVRPHCRRISVLVLADRVDREALQTAVHAALPAGWEARFVPVAAVDRIADQIGAVTEDTDAVWTYPDSTLFTDASVRMLLLTALRRRVAVFGFSPSFVRAGALVGVGIDTSSQGLQAANLVIELNARPTDMPVHLPPRHQTALNLVVARKLGLQPPAALIAATDIVIDTGR